jgi:two-component system, OmpR family, response regulator
MTIPTRPGDPPAVTPESMSGVLRSGKRLGLRVLVVDDNRDAADSLGIIYDMLGAAVRVCYDGTSALRELGTFWPHVGLFDVNMPGIDGVELATRVRAAARGRPLLLAAITGVSDEDARARTAAVFDVHLTKPADPTDLFAVIRRFKEEHPDTSR